MGYYEFMPGRGLRTAYITAGAFMTWNGCLRRMGSGYLYNPKKSKEGMVFLLQAFMAWGGYDA